MIANIYRLIMRRLRLIRFNRNLLVFLIFLVVSIAFWFLQSLQEDTEVNITYNLQVDDVPRDIIFTTDLPATVSATFVGKGWDAFYYKYLLNEPHVLAVKFKDISTPSGHIVIDANHMRRSLAKVSDKDLKFSSVTPNKIEAYYSKGRHKRVPVALGGRIILAGGRYLCGTSITPDSVDIFAPDRILDSVRLVQTKSLPPTALEDSLTTKLALQVPRGAKLSQDSVKVQLNIDIFTDKTLKVPIYCDNVPKNKIIRLFPLKADVTFLVSATHYGDITPDDFIIVVDYEETRSNPKRCKLHVSQKPSEVRNLRLSPEYVEYVIEMANE